MERIVLWPSNPARVCQPDRNGLKCPVRGCHRNQPTGAFRQTDRPLGFSLSSFKGARLPIRPGSLLAMEPFTPYANGLPSWHHGGHFDPFFHDDSGYASEDSNPVPFPSLNADGVYGDTDHGGHGFPRTRRRRAAAFVSAQWSRPAASRARQHPHDSFSDGWRTYDLPQSLPFEQQRNSYRSGSRLEPAILSNRDIFDREAGYTGSRWDSEDHIPPLDLKEHRARVPDGPPSLSHRIESETDDSSHSSRSTRHSSSSPGVKCEDPQSKISTGCAHPGHRTEGSMRSSARRRRRHHSSSCDAQLAAAWQQLHQARTELERERKAPKRKGKKYPC